MHKNLKMSATTAGYFTAQNSRFKWN